MPDPSPTPIPEPTTEAGRALVASFGTDWNLGPEVAAIEAEARAQLLAQVAALRDAGGEVIRQWRDGWGIGISSAALEDLEALLASSTPAVQEWRERDRAEISEDPEADGSLDDLAVRGGIESFRIERMDSGHWWFAVYLNDGSRLNFNLHSSRKISAHYEHEPSTRAALSRYAATSGEAE